MSNFTDKARIDFWIRKPNYGKYTKKARTLPDLLKDIKSRIELNEREAKSVMEYLDNLIKENNTIMAKLVEENLLKREELVKSLYKDVQDTSPAGDNGEMAQKRKHTLQETVEKSLDKLCHNLRNLNLTQYVTKKKEDSMEDCNKKICFFESVKQKQSTYEDNLLQRLRTIYNSYNKVNFKWEMACNTVATYKYLVNQMKKELINIPHELELSEKGLTEAKKELGELSILYENEAKRCLKAQTELENTKRLLIVGKQTQESNLEEKKLKNKKLKTEKSNKDTGINEAERELKENRMISIKKELEDTEVKFTKLKDMNEAIKSELDIKKLDDLPPRIHWENSAKEQLMAAINQALETLICKKEEIRHIKENMEAAEIKRSQELDKMNDWIYEIRNLYLMGKERHFSVHKRSLQIKDLLDQYESVKKDLCDHIATAFPVAINSQTLTEAKEKLEDIIEELRPKPTIDTIISEMEVGDGEEVYEMKFPLDYMGAQDENLAFELTEAQNEKYISHAEAKLKSMKIVEEAKSRKT
ncbi:kinesin heavy chain-like [Octopus sinensis]|uniref:Kinesin heavy chain-like n=1 Tax=Octopus sinensis TaxID=2607531 RepID=A0A6P7SEU6_9MOLL|nr:kinesin heavy chain-like [Octopus sinensis]